MCEALTYLLDTILIRFGTKLYRQILGIPMGTNCASFIADLLLFCYRRDSMAFLSCNKKAEIIKAIYSTPRYLVDLLNITNPYFEGMVCGIYPPEIKLMCLIPKSHFRTYVYLFQTDLIHPKFMLNAMTLILGLEILLSVAWSFGIERVDFFDPVFHWCFFTP